MKSIRIWFWCVGVFYLLLTFMNLWILLLNPEYMSSHLPPQYNLIPEAVKSFSDAWLVFIFELGVLGIFCIVAAKNPIQHYIVAWLVIFAEVFRGVIADLVWISRGYEASRYIGFIAIHLVIIITGIIFLRRVKRAENNA